MKNLLILLFFLISFCSLQSQQTLVLNTGKTLDGTLTLLNKKHVIFRLAGKSREVKIERSKVKEIHHQEQNPRYKSKKLKVKLKGGGQMKARLISMTKDEFVVVKSLASGFDTLGLHPDSVRSMVYEKPVLFDVGFLRGGGALVGIDSEIVIGEYNTLAIGGGFVGFGVGLNFFFLPNFQGPGLKFSYNNQGFGPRYAGSLLGGTVFYKFRRGLSIDLGLAKVVKRGNYDYGGADFVVFGGVGYRI